MDQDTRQMLYDLGWVPHICRDHKGRQYEAWTRGTAYFHVYHEATEEEFIRPYRERRNVP